MKGVSFVSNYDEKIRNAFDKIEPRSDDESFIRSIIERADNMEKEKGIIKTEQKHLVEITVPKVEKKPGRAPWIIGAAGLTAAALAIGFIAGGHFGSGKDIETTPANGAGYSGSQAAETTVSHVPHIPEASLGNLDSINYYTEAVAFYEFENVSVRPTGYYFDGISLKLYYDVISKADTFDSGDLNNYVQLRPDDDIGFAGESEIASVDGNTAHFVMTARVYSRTRDLELYFGTNTKKDDGNYELSFMLDDDKMFPVECRDMSYLFSYEGAKSTVSYAQICNVYVSPLGYVITYPGKGMDGWGDGNKPESVPDVKIELADGTNAQTTGQLRSFFGDKFGYIDGRFIEKLDTRMIKNIIIDNTVVYSAPDGGMASDGVAASADDPSMYEFRDYSVRIKSITFTDNILNAEYDVIYPNGIPTSDSESGEPRVLLCPAQNIWSFEREVPGMEISRSMASDSHTMHYNVSFKYDSFTGDATVVFYDTKHFPYSNDIPYDMTYSVPITVVGEKGWFGAVTTAVEPVVTSTYFVETNYMQYLVSDLEFIKYELGDYIIEPVGCEYDGNIIRMEFATTDDVLDNGLAHGTPYLASIRDGKVQNGWGNDLTNGFRKTGDNSFVLYAELPAQDNSQLGIAVMREEQGDKSRSQKVFSFTIGGIDKTDFNVCTDNVGIDLGKAGFGPEGLKFNSITVSDTGVVFTFTCADNSVSLDLNFTAKDKDGNEYNIAKDGVAYQDIGSGFYVYKVLVSPELGGKKFTDMKLISVNGFEVLLSEMSRTERPEYTTAVVSSATATAETTTATYPSEADTTAVPVV